MATASISKHDSNIYISHLLHYLNEKESLFFIHTLRHFSLSLMGIYLPVYIYKLSHDYQYFSSNTFINGVIWNLIYFMIRSGFAVLTIIFIGPIIFKNIHLNRALVFSSIVLIIKIFLWLLAEHNLFIILLAAIFSGIELVLYWIPYHNFFVKKVTQNSTNIVSNTGIRDFLIKSTGLFGPLFGGIIISIFGFNILFYISIFLIAISTIPIITSVREWKHHPHSINNVIFKFLVNPKYKLITLAFAGLGVEAVLYEIFWSLYLFLILNNFLKLGLLNSTSLLLSSFLLLFVGKSINKHGIKLIHGLGTINNFLLYLARILTNTPFLLVSIDIIDRLNSPFFSVPNTSIAYQKSLKLGRTDFLLYREITIHLFITFTLAILIFIFKHTLVWKWIFLLTAVCAFLSYLIDFDKN